MTQFQHAYTICIFNDSYQTAKKVFGSIPNDFIAIPYQDIHLTQVDIYPLADDWFTMEEVAFLEAKRAQELRSAASRQRFHESLPTGEDPSAATSDYSDNGVLGDTTADTSFYPDFTEQLTVPDNVSDENFNDFLQDLAGDPGEPIKVDAEAVNNAGKVPPNPEEAPSLMGELVFNNDDNVPQNSPKAQENHVVESMVMNHRLSSFIQ